MSSPYLFCLCISTRMAMASTRGLPAKQRVLDGMAASTLGWFCYGNASSSDELAWWRLHRCDPWLWFGDSERQALPGGAQVNEPALRRVSAMREEQRKSMSRANQLRFFEAGIRAARIQPDPGRVWRRGFEQGAHAIHHVRIVIRGARLIEQP
ncbi:hypothetical protein [Burkholderia pseudomultivorans]|uniref:hypothetical protein n=1 Tax=Burkholderia pseudomultivorans TaxID=1207504 RepID=UPI0012D8ECB0|nr:hypothetical protein [Burkholderia pseudomultivorans]